MKFCGKSDSGQRCAVSSLDGSNFLGHPQNEYTSSWSSNLFQSRASARWVGIPKAPDILQAHPSPADPNEHREEAAQRGNAFFLCHPRWQGCAGPGTPPKTVNIASVTVFFLAFYTDILSHRIARFQKLFVHPSTPTIQS